MALFEYKAVSPSGETVRGTMEATSKDWVIAKLQEGGNSFFEYAMSMARSHRDFFASITDMSEQRHEEFLQEAEQSWSRQREIEAADSISFAEYLAHYYAAE